MSNDERPPRASNVWPALQAVGTLFSVMVAALAISIAICQSYSLGALYALEHRIELLEQRPQPVITPDPIVWPPGQNTDPVPWCWPQGREGRGQTKSSSRDYD